MPFKVSGFMFINFEYHLLKCIINCCGRKLDLHQTCTHMGNCLNPTNLQLLLPMCMCMYNTIPATLHYFYKIMCYKVLCMWLLRYFINQILNSINFRGWMAQTGTILIHIFKFVCVHYIQLTAIN